MKALPFKLLCVAVLGFGLWITAGGSACKDNYTQCTEGGCATLEYALECTLKCQLTNGYMSLKCGYPKPEL